MASIESLDHASSVIKQLRVRSGHKSRYGDSGGAASSTKTGLESIQDFNKLIINTKDHAVKKEKTLLQAVSPSSSSSNNVEVKESSESFADNLKAMMIGIGNGNEYNNNNNNNNNYKTKSSNQLKHLNEDETIESYISLAPVGRSVLQRRVGNNPYKTRDYDEDNLDFSSDDEAYHEDNQAVNLSMMSPPKAANDFGLSEDDRNMYDDLRYNDMEGVGGFSLASSTTSPKKTNNITNTNNTNRQWSTNNHNNDNNSSTFIDSPLRSSSAHSSFRNSSDPSTLGTSTSTSNSSNSRSSSSTLKQSQEKREFRAGASIASKFDTATVVQTDSGARIQVTAGQALRVLPKAKVGRGSKTRALMDLKKEKEKLQANKMSF